MIEKEKKEWKKFLNGKWTKEIPLAQAGHYPLATRRGDGGGYLIVVAALKGKFIAVHNRNWEGWFWSEPQPNLPDPPTWEGDSK